MSAWKRRARILVSPALLCAIALCMGVSGERGLLYWVVVAPVTFAMAAGMVLTRWDEL